MALVSIAEAAKLVGKSKRTIYNDLHKGKLSASQDCTDGKTIDTSELVRVYGALVAQLHSAKTVQSSQLCTTDCTPEIGQKIAVLEAENAALKTLLDEREKRLADKDKMILLLEHKQARPWWKIW
jgi:flagellar motility protein MotE (MotC chaperone)